MMTQKKPRTLYKATYDEGDDLRISTKSLLSIIFLTIAFILFCFLIKGPTYGVL